MIGMHSRAIFVTAAIATGFVSFFPFLSGHGETSLPSFLTEQLGRKATVVVFLGVGCPVSNAYIPRLNELASQYAPRGVIFLGVNSNPHESALAVARHALDYKIQFCMLKDTGQRIALALHAERTPQAFLLDGKGGIRYQGRIDDQITIGSRKQSTTEYDLQNALDEFLAGRAIRRSRSEVTGCAIEKDPKATSDDITYTRQVVRIMQEKCQSCHRPEGVGPFSLMTYEQAKGLAKTIKEAVTTRRMPPWHADPHFGKFSNDRSLSEDQMNTIISWVDAGAPKGDDNDLPPPLVFPGTWRIGKPHLVVTMPKPFDVPADGVLDYQRFVVDPELKEDVWVERAEAMPGCKAVHHILVFIQEPGKPEYDQFGNTTVLCGTAPGDMPLILPPGHAKKIPAGAKLLFEVHYTPNGKACKDQSSVGMIFSREPPKQEVKTNILAKIEISIPPGASDHPEEAFFRFPQDIRVISFMPHMHYRGKSFEYRVIYPDGRTETLLKVPKFDFNWQSVYRFVTPPLIPKGATLQCIAHWDNSRENQLNPDSTKIVKYGLQTWDEMMNGWMDYVVD